MNTKKSNSLLFAIFVLLAVILIVSCKPQLPEKETPQDTKIKEFETTQELKKFSSAQEIRKFLQNSAISSASISGAFEESIGVRRFAAAAVAEGAPSVAKSADASTAIDYSQTNVQVAGVDEADFVKNDNKYIYVISQNRLIIVDAFPADNAKLLSETKIDGTPRDMFVNKDRLVVFAEDNEEIPIFAEFDFVPRPRYASKTHAFVYDISDREKPKLVKDYNLNGYYTASRMIDANVYFIVRDDVYYNAQVIDLPVIKEASRTVIKPDIYYFDNPEQYYNFNTVASFNIFGDEDEVDAKTFMMGYSNVIYVSSDNIYITYQKNLPYTYYESHSEERFYKIVAPLLPRDVQDAINDVKDDTSLNNYEKWSKISAVLEEMYNTMDEDEKLDLIQNIEEAIAEYESRLEIERRKTVIHKIKIDNGEIEYDSRGEVPGYLLNQFSMDEFDGYLRVATTMEFYGRVPILMEGVGVRGSAGSTSTTAVETIAISGKAVADQPVSKIMESNDTEDYWTEEKMAEAKPMPMGRIAPPIESKYNMYNNVYVLDDNMKIVGQLEALAPDERIYSTRFIGDRLYMVTFKRIDPLFVIDLSDPKKPEILGQLKIPGFSDYLHPYDENHIIGIGKETDSNEWGGVSVKGVKLALFDVSDVNSPKQLDKYEIGDSGTDSEALRDHKAFLFDKKKNVLVIPVTEVKSKPYYDPKLGYYRQRFWQGAYVFSVNPEEGFKVKGTITHNEGDEERDYYYYGSPNAVRRSLYMEDILYTVSLAKIKANNLDDISQEINEVKLPFENPRYGYPYTVKTVASSPGVVVPEEVTG